MMCLVVRIINVQLQMHLRYARYWCLFGNHTSGGIIHIWVPWTQPIYLLWSSHYLDTKVFVFYIYLCFFSSNIVIMVIKNNRLNIIKFSICYDDILGFEKSQYRNARNCFWAWQTQIEENKSWHCHKLLTFRVQLIRLQLTINQWI